MCSITLLARSPWFLSATFATLTTFNQQKHGIHNEKVGHGRSRHSLLCPVHTLANPVITMHWQHASFETPLDTVCADHSAPWSYSPLSSLLLPDSKPHCISIPIRQTFWHTFPESAPPHTCTGSAMALRLCAGFDSIKFVCSVDGARTRTMNTTGTFTFKSNLS